MTGWERWIHLAWVGSLGVVPFVRFSSRTFRARVGGGLFLTGCQKRCAHRLVNFYSSKVFAFLFLNFQDMAKMKLWLDEYN